MKYWSDPLDSVFEETVHMAEFASRMANFAAEASHLTVFESAAVEQLVVLVAVVELWPADSCVSVAAATGHLEASGSVAVGSVDPAVVKVFADAVTKQETVEVFGLFVATSTATSVEPLMADRLEFVAALLQPDEVAEAVVNGVAAVVVPTNAAFA